MVKAKDNKAAAVHKLDLANAPKSSATPSNPQNVDVTANTRSAVVTTE